MMIGEHVGAVGELDGVGGGLLQDVLADKTAAVPPGHFW